MVLPWGMLVVFLVANLKEHQRKQCTSRIYSKEDEEER